MKIKEQCPDCVLKRTRGILDRGNLDDPDAIFLEVRQSIDYLIDNQEESWIPGEISPAQLGTKRQEIFNKYGLGDVYQKEKIMGKEIGLEFYKKYKDTDRSLLNALLIAVAGNSIEFDVGGVFKDKESIAKETLSSIDLITKDDNYIIEARKAVEFIDSLEPGEILYMLDNVGEHYFDLLFINQLVKCGWRVVLVVKGKPILNDVTREDLDDFPIDIEILDTGNQDVGLFLSRVSSELRDRIFNADFLILKGMANFETLSRSILNTPSLYLLKAKCDPVADTLGVNKGTYLMRTVDADKSFI